MCLCNLKRFQSSFLLPRLPVSQNTIQRGETYFCPLARTLVSPLTSKELILSLGAETVPSLRPAVYFARYYYVGLGYRILKRFSKLIIWLGLTHYFVLRVPETIRILIRKKRIYLVSSFRTVLNAFLSQLHSLKPLDIYKGKGLLRVKKYKNFTAMKTGKKKQYH